MTKFKDYKNMVEQEPLLWSDRKRILGMPISFTKYAVDKNRLYLQKGLLHTEINELLLYRVLDVKSVRSLGQKIFGVGTISLMSSDQSTPRLDLINIKDCEQVRRFLSKLIEQQRSDLGIRGREIYGSAIQAGTDVPGGVGIDLDGDGIPD